MEKVTTRCCSNTLHTQCCGACQKAATETQPMAEDSPTKAIAKKRLRVEHSYSRKSSTDFSTATTTVTASSGSSTACQLHDVSNKNATAFSDEYLTTSGNLAKSNADSTSHSVTASTLSAAVTASDCLGCRTFSHSVSAALRLMVKTNNWDRNILTTCWFLDMMNKWFDLMSSRHPIIAISKFDVNQYKSTLSFLHSVVDVFESIAIAKPGMTASWKPVQSGVILSTLSVLQLQDRLLNTENFHFLLTARLTQDCLENLFSCVRSKNAVPTSLEFKNNLRLLTVSQYLKGADSGSYELADGGLAADFLAVQVKCKVDDPVNDTLFAACQPLLGYGNMCTVELDSTELCCLYYFGGYILSRVNNNDVTCSSCIASVKAQDYTQELGTEITRLLTLKEYKPGCLTPCNETAFSILMSAEVAFRQCEQSFLSSSDDIRDQLLREIMSRTSEVNLPECHGIKRKLIRRFIGARLQFFAMKQRSLRKEKVAKKSCHEMSSKSMQMRKSVSKIK